MVEFLIQIRKINNVSEYTELLYVLNKEQQKYLKKIEVTIEPIGDTIHFTYKNLYFGLEIENLNLQECSEKITNQLLGKPIDTYLMYYKTLLYLSSQLNSFDIGVVVNIEMEMRLEKKIKKLVDRFS